MARYTKVEIRRIGKDGKVWTLLVNGGEKFPVLAPDARQMTDNFEDADDGERFRTNDGSHTCAAEMRTGTSKEIEMLLLSPIFEATFAQLTNQKSGVRVAGSFAR